MKKIVLFFSFTLFLHSLYAQEKRDVLIKKYFRNNNTYVIVCKGYPKVGLEGKMAISTAKEAALLNAQVIAKETFVDSVDVFKRGIVEKYDVQEGYVIISYVIKQNDLKSKLRK